MGMRVFGVQGSETELLFLSTERYKFCVLKYDRNTGRLETLFNGDTQAPTAPSLRAQGTR
jgi:hypothetical protein